MIKVDDERTFFNEKTIEAIDDMVKNPNSKRIIQNHRFSSLNLFCSDLANFFDMKINIIPDITKQRASNALVL